MTHNVRRQALAWRGHCTPSPAKARTVAVMSTSVAAMSQEQHSTDLAAVATENSLQQQSLQAAAAAVEEGVAAPAPSQAPLSPEHVARNTHLAERLRGKLILAPLTRGGHLPFRQLCADFGAEVTMSEMAFARQLLKGDRKEAAMLRRAPNEACYGVQIATNAIDEGLRAGRAVAETGADWLDLNVRGRGNQLLLLALAALIAHCTAVAASALSMAEKSADAVRGLTPYPHLRHGRSAAPSLRPHGVVWGPSCCASQRSWRGWWLG